MACTENQIRRSGGGRLVRALPGAIRWGLWSIVRVWPDSVAKGRIAFCRTETCRGWLAANRVVAGKEGESLYEDGGDGRGGLLCCCGTCVDISGGSWVGGDVLRLSQVSAGVVRLRVLPVENSSKEGIPARMARLFSSVTRRWSLASGWL